MKSKKFNSFEEAKEHCNKAGKLKYWGRQGIDFEYCVYTLQIGSKIFHCNVYDNGLLKVVDERWG